VGEHYEPFMSAESGAYRSRLPKIRQPHAIPATMTSLGHVSRDAPLCAGPADALTGWRRYHEVYLRGREKWGVKTSLRYVWFAYRYGVVLSGSAHNSDSGKGGEHG
jgi:hypothetical protein